MWRLLWGSKFIRKNRWWGTYRVCTYRECCAIWLFFSSCSVITRKKGTGEILIQMEILLRRTRRTDYFCTRKGRLRTSVIANTESNASAIGQWKSSAAKKKNIFMPTSNGMKSTTLHSWNQYNTMCRSEKEYISNFRRIFVELKTRCVIYLVSERKDRLESTTCIWQQIF